PCRKTAQQTPHPELSHRKQFRFHDARQCAGDFLRRSPKIPLPGRSFLFTRPCRQKMLTPESHNNVSLKKKYCETAPKSAIPAV
ncbi:MAG: hypothetical protein K2O70_00640, partial [Desulfovibrionaceae bacterium]|nr:hypothetical protein [Desulfovibrionaceae bacterium]